jgi:hypothetical protein
MRTDMRWTIFATAFALWAIPTIASAHGGNNDPNVVHACIGNVSKVARIVGVSGSCIPAPHVLAETAAHWAMQGAQGVAGSNGTNGINGANGTNGTNGINGTNGTDGTNGVDGTSVTFVDYFSGNENGCPNGGAIYAAGNPPVNAYICNGTNGINGTNGTNGTGATRPDPPCFDNTNRYVNCGNGTVTDTVTGLIWLRQADCLPSKLWAAANQAAATLKEGDCGLTDGSSAGDWRLPTEDEWSATMARAAVLDCKSGPGSPGTAPSLTNDAGTACLSAGPSSFLGVMSVGHYWSSASDENLASIAGIAALRYGHVERSNKVNGGGVWPVRGGTR